jgi:hypothetical protein
MLARGKAGKRAASHAFLPDIVTKYPGLDGYNVIVFHEPSEGQASPITDEEHSLPPIDHQVGSSPSYAGCSSSSNEGEGNLEDDEDCTRFLTCKSYAIISITNG